MASNYQQFAEAIPLGKNAEAKIAWVKEVLECTEAGLYGCEENGAFLTPKEVTEKHCEKLTAFLGHELVELLGDTTNSWPEFEWEIEQEDEKDEAFLHIYATEDFDLDHVIAFVRAFLQTFEPRGVFKMTWSSHCTRPRIGEFDGGWCIVDAHNFVTHTAHEAVNESFEDWLIENRGHPIGRGKPNTLAERAKKVTRIDDPDKEAVMGAIEQEFGDIGMNPCVELPAPIQNRLFQVGSETGRTSSAHPNEANIRTTEDDFEARAKRAIHEFLENSREEGETIGDCEARYRRDRYGAELLKDIDRIAACECDGGAFPGIHLPLGHDENFDHAWVQRCDQCQLFKNDDFATFFVARKLGLEVGYARIHDGGSARAYLKDLTFEEAMELERKLRTR